MADYEPLGRHIERRPPFNIKQSIVRSLTVGRDLGSKSGNNDGSISSAMFLVILLSFGAIMVSMKNQLFDLDKGKFKYAIQALPALMTFTSTILLLVVNYATDRFTRWSWLAGERDESLIEDRPRWKMVAAFVFGTGTMVMNIFFIYDHWHCITQPNYIGYFNIIWMLVCFLQIIFVAVQMHYMYYVTMKAWRYYNHPLLRYVLLVIISCNVLWYISYFLIQISDVINMVGLTEDLPPGWTPVTPVRVFCEALATSSYNNVQVITRPYLQPFIMEYNLVAVEIMLHIWLRMKGRPPPTEASPDAPGTSANSSIVIRQTVSLSDTDDTSINQGSQIRRKGKGKNGVRGVEVGTQTNEQTVVSSGGDEITMELSSIFHHQPGRRRFYRVCEKVLYPAVLILCVIHVTTLVLFGVDVDYPYGNTGMVYRSISILVLVSTVFGVQVGFWYLGDETYQNNGTSGSDILLLIAVVGYIINYSLRALSGFICAVSPSMCPLVNNAAARDMYFTPTAMPALVFVQAGLYLANNWLQTMFLIRCAKCTVPSRRDKRSILAVTVMALGCLNFFMWARKSFVDMNIARTYAVSKTFYGEGLWSGVSRVATPFCLFYHFHSAILFIRYYFYLKSYNPRST